MSHLSSKRRRSIRATVARVALEVALPDGLHVQSDRPRDPSLIPTVLEITAPAGAKVRSIAYPKATDFRQENLDQPLSVFGSTFVVGAIIAVGQQTTPGPLNVAARLRYQACDDKVCFPPATVDSGWTLQVAAPGTAVTLQRSDLFDALQFANSAVTATSSGTAVTSSDDTGLERPNRFAVVATTGGYLPSEEFPGFLRDAEAGVTPSGLFENRGPLAILLIVLLGGLALNLTPCVLPMIPINLAIIGAGAATSTRRRGFLLGAVYGGAMAVVYGVLGLVVIVTAGTFGSINASPWFNIAIAAVFVCLALAMFGVFEIDLSRFSSGFTGAGARRGSVGLAFTMGGVAALLAGACVAPVVIQVVLFSSTLYSGGTTAALALPFLLGVGMGAPWPLAGAGFASLPKPGAWMVRVKQGFGVLILVMATYYGYLAFSLFSDRWVDAAVVRSSVEEQLKSGWYASLDEALVAAEREQKPVLVDMWATWCKNCLTMDKTTFKDPAVVAALSGYVKVKVQAEDPDAPRSRELMTRFNAIGLPAYAVLRPAQHTGRDGENE